jgi:hypothetical protein
MGFAPLAHPLDVRRTAEVMLVLRLTQPATLTLGLTGLATLQLGAKPLMPSVPRVGIEQLPAMQTLPLIELMHRQQ